MKILETRIKLYVSDFDQRYNFYAKELGWEVAYQWDEPQGKRGVMFKISEAIIFELLEDLEAQKHTKETDVSFMVRDVWELWEKMKFKFEIDFEIRNNPWGDTSFCIKDPGGFKLTFFSPN